MFRWSSPMPKGAAVPGVVERHTRRKAKADALQAAYKAVDTRDGSICWVTGRYTVAGAPNASVRREHHHLKGRRVEPQWRADPHRILTVCKEAHDLITAGWIVVEGTDARRAIFFHWRADVKPHQKTLVIQRKNVRPDKET